MKNATIIPLAGIEPAAIPVQPAAIPVQRSNQLSYRFQLSSSKAGRRFHYCLRAYIVASMETFVIVHGR